MSEESVANSSAVEEERPNPLKEITQPFVDFVKAPRALWGVNLSYFLEGIVYWGILGYLSMYFSKYLALDDHQASVMTGVLTFGITFTQLALGGVCDKKGIRFAILAAIVFMLVGRIVLASVPLFGLTGGGYFTGANLLALLGIVFIVIGFGMYQPSLYAAARQLTTAKTSAMAYAMLYAFNNLGGFMPFFFPKLRERIDISGMFWVLVGVAAVGLLITSILLNRRTIEKTLAEVELQRSEEDRAAGTKKEEEKPKPAGFVEWLKQHPLADLRFTFFIFALIPVQTLFAYNWLTLPKYVERAYRGEWIGTNFEAASAFNPLLIFVLLPFIAAATRKANVYTMMIVGTLVMAAPTFLLSLGTNLWLLVAFVILSTIGEAMWQPRFLQYAAEIAPKGRTGQYMGVAQLPWFLTKLIVPLYAGWFLMKYCPEHGEQRPTTMWFIYACIAMASTVLLVVAKGWMTRGFKVKA